MLSTDEVIHSIDMFTSNARVTMFADYECSSFVRILGIFISFVIRQSLE